MPLVPLVPLVPGSPARAPRVAEGRRWGRAGLFVPVLLACLAVHLAWAFALPITSGPDENSHVYRAVSLWQGDLVPSERAADGQWLLRVPESVKTYTTSTECTRFHPEVPASCATPVTEAGGSTWMPTAAGRYFPLYYYVVGAPGHVDAGVTGFYAMRIASLVVASLLLALAVTTVVRTIGPLWACLALPLAVTPQVLWLGSVINPNAWELDAGLLTWAAGLALVCGCSPESPRMLWAKFALGASVLVLMRRLSPMWLVLIVAVLAAVWCCLPAEARRDRRLLIPRQGRWVLAALAGLIALSVWWHLTFDLATVEAAGGVPPAAGGFAETLRAMLPDIPWWVRQTYGVFGWLDTVTPGVAVLTWLALGTLVFVLVVVGSRHRLRVVLVVGACAALTVVIPLAFSLTVGRQVGLHFWQGRYTMPFGQGIPLVLGVLGAGWRGQPTELTTLLRGARIVPWLLWPVLTTVAFVLALHRYAKGDGGDWSLGTLPWTPPGGIALLVGSFVLGICALTWSLTSTARIPAGTAARRVVSPLVSLVTTGSPAAGRLSSGSTAPRPDGARGIAP